MVYHFECAGNERKVYYYELRSLEDLIVQMYDIYPVFIQRIDMTANSSDDPVTNKLDRIGIWIKESPLSNGEIACEMEGGSIGHVCYVNKVPFAILRSISDGEGASMDYATFAEKAALQSILVVIDFIQRADELQA